MKSLPISLILLIVVGTTTARGQSRIRGHVYLPPTQGATVLSTYIDAEARRIVAMGDFLESAAVARKINLESDRLAMENSVRWVETYFERRKLNRQYRDEMQPSYREQQTILAQNLHRRISNAEKTGNQTDEINYMMGRLLADPATFKAIFINEAQLDSEPELTITPNELSHILLKEEAGTTGARPFRPSEPQLVADSWPKIFMRTEFDLERTVYDEARRKAITEIGAGALTAKRLEELQAALKQVEKKFDRVYAWKQMKETIDFATYSAYRKSGENFLRAQAAGSLRAFVLDDPDSYANDLQFDGENLIDLLRHCAQHSLVFAEPEPDDEGTYNGIHHLLRQVYLAHAPEQPDFNQ